MSLVTALALAAGTALLAPGALAQAMPQPQPEQPPSAPPPVRTSLMVEPPSDQALSAPSVAYLWSEAALFAVRNDFARPPVHARNLYHLAGAMYDAWALFEPWATPLFMESGAHASCSMDESSLRALARVNDTPQGLRARLRERVLSQAAWRVLRYRYRNAQSADLLRAHVDAVAAAQGLSSGRGESSPAAQLGARIAACVIGMGRRDNANEDSNYTNLEYVALNPPLDPQVPGNPTLSHPSRWQPLALQEFIDQAGKRARASEFVGAEWGQVRPFALRESDRSQVERDGRAMTVYHDPGPPPTFEDAPEAYARQFARVAAWSGHLDPASGAIIDIAPRARAGELGIDDLTTDPIAQLAFYPLDGKVRSLGDTLEPVGSRPAVPVPLGDYARVIAEYWADGPDSETPPGHWFSLYNDHVSRHPDLQRRIGGRGPALDPLAFDVLAYLTLGGALHDAAIAAWSSKGAYDFVRPVSAIRFLADQPPGSGMPTIPRRIERIERGGTLAGVGGLHIGGTRLFGWLGPGAINDPQSDVAGVGWMLARAWWPYQRPNFVTPPFAGYVSGHSTFSRAAAVVLERLTGSPFWPGGGAGFTARANDFLVFERGPSVDVPLQWATFRDAADQSGLSRVWGGIHPPVDDLAGRRMGMKVGEAAWRRARALFDVPQALQAAQNVVSATGAVSGQPDGEPDVPMAQVPTGGCSSTGSRRSDDLALFLMLGGAGFGLGHRRRRA